jgi:hypothetical protein
MFQVNPDLMCSAGFERQLQECRFGCAGSRFVAGTSRPTVDRNRHLFAPLRVSSYRSVDQSLGRFWGAKDNRQVDLGDGAAGEIGAQLLVGLGGPSDDHDATRALVQPVDDTGPTRAADLGDFREVCEQAVRQSSAFAAGTRVDDEIW